jgi:hypothetical protein
MNDNRKKLRPGEGPECKQMLEGSLPFKRTGPARNIFPAEVPEQEIARSKLGPARNIPGSSYELGIPESKPTARPCILPKPLPTPEDPGSPEGCTQTANGWEISEIIDDPKEPGEKRIFTGKGSTPRKARESLYQAAKAYLGDPGKVDESAQEFENRMSVLGGFALRQFCAECEDFYQCEHNYDHLTDMVIRYYKSRGLDTDDPEIIGQMWTVQNFWNAYNAGVQVDGWITVSSIDPVFREKKATKEAYEKYKQYALQYREWYNNLSNEEIKAIAQDPERAKKTNEVLDWLREEGL